MKKSFSIISLALVTLGVAGVFSSCDGGNAYKDVETTFFKLSVHVEGAEAEYSITPSDQSQYAYGVYKAEQLKGWTCDSVLNHDAQRVSGAQNGDIEPLAPATWGLIAFNINDKNVAVERTKTIKYFETKEVAELSSKDAALEDKTKASMPHYILSMENDDVKVRLVVKASKIEGKLTDKSLINDMGDDYMSFVELNGVKYEIETLTGNVEAVQGGELYSFVGDFTFNGGKFRYHFKFLTD